MSWILQILIPVDFQQQFHLIDFVVRLKKERVIIEVKLWMQTEEIFK